MNSKNGVVLEPSNNWSKPRRLSEDERARVLRNPSVAFRHGEMMVAGYRTEFYDELTDRDALVFVPSAGDPFGGPPGHWSFLSSKIAYSPNGTLHMIWGEPAVYADRLVAGEWISRRITAIWQASRDPGGIWSEPTQLLKGQSIDWNEQRRGEGSQLTIPISVSVVAMGPPTGLRVVTMVLSDSGWIVLPNDAIGDAALRPNTVATTGLNQCVYVVTHGSKGHDDENGVIVARYWDPGVRRWSTPGILRITKNNSVGNLRLTPFTSDSIALVWSEGRGNENWIHVAIGSQKSDRWVQGDSLLLTFPPTNVQLLSLKDGTLHLLADEARMISSNSAVHHFVYRQTWDIPRRLFVGLGATATKIALGPSGLPVAIFTQTKEDKIRTMRSELLVEMNSTRPRE